MVKLALLSVIICVNTLISVGYSQSSDYIFQQGFEHYESGNFIKAKSLYEKAIEIDRKNKTPDYLKYYNLAVVYKGLDELEISIGYYDTCIYLNPDMYQAYDGRAGSFMLLGLFDKAMIDFNNAINISNQSLSWYNRGLLHFWQGNYENAILDFEYSYNQQNKNSETLFLSLAKCYAKTGNIEKAIFYYEKAIKTMEHEDGEAIEALIWIEANKSNLDKTKLCKLLNQLIEINNRLNDYLFSETIKEYSSICQDD
ncbi:hypothetical protein GCM10009118_24400 [Wandonia haliotis]|uniref:Tetratricopeptide repeat protein n=1 Tax=Wandonia haliotis TaxID=574963 RepID=A0ABP3Y5M0_9FLAO